MTDFGRRTLAALRGWNSLASRAAERWEISIVLNR